MANQTKYNADALTVLEGLRPVRVRPGMYIGDTDSKGMHHLLWEILDNAVDEAVNGYANRITVTVCEDNSMIVTDNGRGMPVDIHPDKKISGVELIFTQAVSLTTKAIRSQAGSTVWARQS